VAHTLARTIAALRLNIKSNKQAKRMRACINGGRMRIAARKVRWHT
jgi:hypothetical protein